MRSPPATPQHPSGASPLLSAPQQQATPPCSPARPPSHPPAVLSPSDPALRPCPPFRGPRATVRCLSTAAVTERSRACARSRGASLPQGTPRAPSAGTRRARKSWAVTAGDPPVPVKRKVSASAQAPPSPALAAAGTPQRCQDRALHSPPRRPPQAVGGVTHSPRGEQRPTPRFQALLPRAPAPPAAAYRVLSLWRGS